MTQGADQIRYGVIGTGMMGVEHIENIRSLDGAVVTASSDTNADSRATGRPGGRTAGRRVRRPPRPARQRAVRRRRGRDARTTPTSTCMPDVLATDLHVMIEKPLCTTVADCERLIGLDAAPARRCDHVDGDGVPLHARRRRADREGARRRGRHARGWSRSGSIGSRSSSRSTTGTGSARTPAARSSRRRATSSI